MSVDGVAHAIKKRLEDAAFSQSDPEVKAKWIGWVENKDVGVGIQRLAVSMVETNPAGALDHVESTSLEELKEAVRKAALTIRGNGDKDNGNKGRRTAI